jgi:hypothetical protein
MERLFGPYIGLEGAPVGGVTVTVYIANTVTPATIYSDDGVTTRSNPLVSDTNGDFFFYVANGLYDLKFEKTGMPTKTYEDVRAYDPTDEPILLAGHLWGLTLSNNGSDATNDIDISVGSCVSDDGSGAIALVSALTKRLDAAWSVGTNQGALDIGTLANGTYHWYAIKRADTGVSDVLASRNPGRVQTFTVTIASPAVFTMADHGLQVGSSFIPTTSGSLPTGLTAGNRYFVISAGFGVDSFQVSTTEGGAAVNTSGTQSGTHTATSNPVMPASYTLKRRIGSTLREAAALVAFVQDGQFFQRTTAVLDVNSTNPGTSAVTRTLSVPIGVKVRALVNALTGNHAANAIRCYLSDLATADSAASSSAAPLATVASSAQNTTGSGLAFIRTTRAGRIRSRVDGSDGTTLVRIAALGWFDSLGREN